MYAAIVWRVVLDSIEFGLCVVKPVAWVWSLNTAFRTHVILGGTHDGLDVEHTVGHGERSRKLFDESLTGHKTQQGLCLGHLSQKFKIVSFFNRNYLHGRSDKFKFIQVELFGRLLAVCFICQNAAPAIACVSAAW